MPARRAPAWLAALLVPALGLTAAAGLGASTAACAPTKPAKTAPPPTGTLQVVSEKADGLGAPEIVYENTTDKAMTVDFVGASKAHLDVPAGATKTVKLPAGTYEATIGGDDLLPSTDTVTFADDFRYRISLKVVLEVDDPAFAGKGLDCFEVQVTPKFMSCARTPANCAALRGKAPPDLSVGACAHYSEVFHLRATPPGKPVRIVFFTTMAACEAVAAEWPKQFPSDVLVPCAPIK
jgi:hypothetical protein